MRTLLALAALSLLTPAFAEAGVNCRFITPSDPVNHANSYDKTFHTVALPQEFGAQTTQFVFVKSDFTVSQMGRDEFYDTKDFSALNGATYFTVQHADAAKYLLSYGKVDTTAENNLAIVAHASGGLADRFSLTAWAEKIHVSCQDEK
ncbi:MAG: hypothetical protein EOP11_25510 [Proteobacteria bacterium]|nr:MAG: hypothetical protein EOP11_25510 [Pseudomonadota bacterium]